MLFEHLQAQAKSPALVDALNMSFYSAILGRAIAGRTGLADSEETFISGLFHNLGRTLVALYLPAEINAIRAEESQESRHRRPQGPRHVLFLDRRRGGARAQSARAPPPEHEPHSRIAGAPVDDRRGEAGRAGDAVQQCRRCAGHARQPQDEEAGDRSPGQARTGAQFAALDSKTMDTLIAGAETELHEHSKTFKLDLDGSTFATGLSEFKADAIVSASVSHISSVSAAGGLVDLGQGDLPADDVPETVLTQGLHEVTSLLVTEFTLDDVLRVILETIYRALGVGRTRAFFLLKDAALPKARFRFGMGQSAADMRTWMEVPLKGTQDLFVLAMNQARDLVIKDLTAADLAPLVPEWYKPTTQERRYAVLLPLVVNQKGVGLFYIDGDEAGARLLTPPVLNNLKVLRSQAVLAIHQSTLRAAARKR